MADFRLDPLCPRVPITLGGETYLLACTLRGWCAFEQRTGRQMFQLANEVDLEHITALIWSMLITEHPEVSEYDVGAAIGGELDAALKAAMGLLVEMQPKKEPTDSSPSTALDWRRLWSIGRYTLRLSDSEFWNLAPWQLVELMERVQDQQDAQFLAAGIVAAQVVNCNIDHEKTEPYSPQFFVPGKIGDAERQRRERDQKIGLKSKLSEFAAAWGPRVKVVRKPRPKK